jgi:hypothetical protein
MNSTIAKKRYSTTSLLLGGLFALTAVSCAGSSDNGGGAGSGGGGSAGGGSTGSSTAAANSDTVTFAAGKGANGPMSGYGWVALGAQDSLSSPVCDATGATPAGGATDEITTAKPCPEVGGKTKWSSDTALCISGKVPIVVNDDYTNNWGAQIGVNTSDPAGDVITKTYSSVTFNYENAPVGVVMRAEIHKKGDDPGTTYCATATPGKALLFSTFSKTCWDGKPANCTFVADGGPAGIDKVGLQVSADTNSAYTLTDLCLKSIEFK